MPGPNTTGLSRPDDLVLGRGKVYLAELTTANKPKGYRFVGNVPEFTLSQEVETLEHRSSIEGLQTVDKEVTISQDLNVSFNFDELNHENFAMFFSGTKATHTNVAIAGFSQWAMIPDGELALGMIYEIRNSSGERAYDIASEDLDIETSNGSPVTLVEGTDYTLDLEMGLIHILSTSSAVATAISGSEDLNVTLTAEATASVVDEVQGLVQTPQAVALKFIGINPANSDSKTEVQVHKITLKGDGDLGLIGEEWAVGTITGKAETAENWDADSPTMVIRTVQA